MEAPPILILKTTVLPKKSTLEQLEVDNSEVNRFIVGDGVKHVKKLEKTSEIWLN